MGSHYNHQEQSTGPLLWGRDKEKLIESEFIVFLLFELSSL